MSGLIILIICCCICAAISQRRSNDMRIRTFKAQEQLFFTILVCYMIVFAGLRTHFNDTFIYIKGFESCKKFPDILKNMDWALGENPGYNIFISIIKAFSDNKHIYLMLSSAIALYPTLWFVRKYSKNFTLSIFLIFMLGYYVFTMAAVKQTIATAFSLIGLDRLIHGKKSWFVFFVLLGMSFHPYCLLYFLAPILLSQIPWKKGMWIMILVTLVIAYSFNFLIGTLLKVTDILGENYDASAFVGEGINIFRVMMYFVPVVISFLWRKMLFNSSSKADNLFVNFSVVCAMIMFIGLFGNANMFARLAKFLDPLVYVSLPRMLYKLRGQLSGMIISVGTYATGPLFFYFQMGMSSEFEQGFRSITIGQFFNSLFN